MVTKQGWLNIAILLNVEIETVETIMDPLDCYNSMARSKQAKLLYIFQ